MHTVGYGPQVSKPKCPNYHCGFMGLENPLADTSKCTEREIERERESKSAWLTGSPFFIRKAIRSTSERRLIRVSSIDWILRTPLHRREPQRCKSAQMMRQAAPLALNTSHQSCDGLVQGPKVTSTGLSGMWHGPNRSPTLAAGRVRSGLPGVSPLAADSKPSSTAGTKPCMGSMQALLHLFRLSPAHSHLLCW